MSLELMLEKWKEARLKYPQHRRDAEDLFFGALVQEIAEIKAEMQRRKGGRPASTPEAA